MIALVKNVNNFQIAKRQPQGVDFFYQFQPGVAYKSVAYKKSVYTVSIFTCG